MNDRELIEHAANAAGYCLVDGSQGYRIFKCKGGFEWDPLLNRSDAFQLAADLGFTVDFLTGTVRGPHGKILAVSDIDIKLAIVRAAAEIGKGK